MKIIALEEHVVTPEALKAWRALDPQWQDPSNGASEVGEAGLRFLEIGADRVAATNDAADAGRSWHLLKPRQEDPCSSFQASPAGSVAARRKP